LFDVKISKKSKVDKIKKLLNRNVNIVEIIQKKFKKQLASNNPKDCQLIQLKGIISILKKRTFNS